MDLNETITLISDLESVKKPCEKSMKTNRQNFKPIQIESIRRRQFKCESKMEISFGKGRKQCGKRRKCWLPAFSSFSTMLSKGFLYRVVKSLDCVIKR